MTRNAVDKHDIKETEQQRKLREQQLKADMLLLCKQPAFLRFYGHVLHETKFMDRCFDLNGSLTNFNLGRRELGIELLVLIESVNPDALLAIRQAMRSLEEKEDGD